MMFSSKFAPAALFLLSLAIGQQQSGHGVASAMDYLAEPKLAWEAQTDAIAEGNGVFTSPDDSISVVTQANGNLDAFDPFTGETLWTFTPPLGEDNKPIGCQGGAVFSAGGITYSVIDDPNGVTPFTRVINLDLDGNVKWISTPLEGVAAGSPVTSFDGQHIYLTHNSNGGSIGHFSVLDSFNAVEDQSVLPIYSEFNTTNPFSPPGIYHNPEEGYYDGGAGNTNDIVIWAHSKAPLDTTVGTGASFVFQFPIGYTSSSTAEARQAGDGSDRLFWTILGANPKNWQVESAPIITNGGRSLYWGVSRSQFRAWVGQAGSGFARFNRATTSKPAFTRGNPRYAAPPNTPALSSDPTQPMIFAGTAANEFVKMNYLMDRDTALVQNTTSPVRARAIVSPDDQFVYYSEFSGVIHQARTDDLGDSWIINDFAALDSEFSLTSDGSLLIAGDSTGKVVAFQVKEAPTSEPTVSTGAPTPAPQGFRPTVDVEIPVPGDVPSARPTRSPIFNPTSPPLEVDVVSAGIQAHASLLCLAATALLAVLI